MAAPPYSARGQWTTGLCDCCTDCSSCWCAWWCPCVLVGRLANILDRGQTTFCAGCCIYYLLAALIGCPCFYTCGYRAKLRNIFGLPAEPCDDCCVDWCCQCCSIAQNYRELKNRNIDPSLGYNEVARAIFDAPNTQMMYK